MRAARACAFACVAVALSACYSGPGTESPTFAHPYPNGVLDAAPAPSPTGMYQMPTFGGYNCCWIGKESSFATTIESGRKQVRVMVSLPPYGPYDARPEALTVRVGDDKPVTFANLHNGVYALDVPVMPRNGDRQALVRISAAYAWIPPGDVRALSVQVRSVHTH